jgi:hypothetical protein
MVKFTPNLREMERFLKSAQMQKFVGDVGDKVAQRAGDGFGSQVNVGDGGKRAGRARATVMAETADAKRRQARDHVLERAIGQGL